jgi:hypothetical protein
MFIKINREFEDFRFSPDSDQSRSFLVQVSFSLIESIDMAEVERGLNAFAWHMLDDSSEGLKMELESNGITAVILYTRGSERFLVLHSAEAENELRISGN